MRKLPSFFSILLFGGGIIFQQPALSSTEGALRAVENAGEGVVTWEGVGDDLVVDLQVGGM